MTDAGTIVEDDGWEIVANEEGKEVDSRRFLAGTKRRENTKTAAAAPATASQRTRRRGWTGLVESRDAMSSSSWPG
jgi:hypothetical protein